ncbi:WD domain, G-beta repeat-containing protein [Toxoplasma gondii ME49]|uniref:WD domain, G-beta repeat-containing protein n=1 Tax=Toxoplasma gondii (strain ATCC 50611 / Me49) TaxID=508771 RepID=S8F6C0_TOXGM|nr:WD domain, G-beta repeat-containing protein [Toxoplasma gondii ME49]EPT30292.1 WD domain, G-beta repeat-containing protein [Toxoplasma gondii ME49]|eukprot:XP_002367466.1 WD domain, G-beta repeat-containing protein [Toxoplasma gondii ME49]
MAAPATLSTFETSHAGCLHSVEFDFFATRLATASSDRTIRLWSLSTPEASTHAGEVAPKTATFLQELRGHEGPVWQVRWAHPSFGNLLASCGYDRRIIVWRQSAAAVPQGPQTRFAPTQSLFTPVYTNEDHTASVNSIAFCPHEFGLHLAAGSSDGSVSVLSLSGDPGAPGAQAQLFWSRKAFAAHFNGVNSVAWAPFMPAASQAGAPALMLATGGCDSQVRIWGLDPNSQEWQQLHQLTDADPHTDWVRDVAFQPASASSLLLSSSRLLASCSEDGTVKLWVGEASTPSANPSATSYTWSLLQTLRLHAPVWRVSWSVSGTILSVACGEKDVCLFRETVAGHWEKVSRLLGPDSLPQVAPRPLPPAAAPGVPPTQPGQQTPQGPQLQTQAPQLQTQAPQLQPQAPQLQPQAPQLQPHGSAAPLGAYPPSHPPSLSSSPPTHPAHGASHPPLSSFPSSHPSLPQNPAPGPLSATPPSTAATPRPLGPAAGQPPQGSPTPGVAFPAPGAPAYPGTPASAGLYGPPTPGVPGGAQSYPQPSFAAPYPQGSAFPPAVQPAQTSLGGQQAPSPASFFPAGTAGSARPKPPAFYNIGAPEAGPTGAAPPAAQPFFSGGQTPGAAPGLQPPTGFPRLPMAAPGAQAYAPRAPMYAPYKGN